MSRPLRNAWIAALVLASSAHAQWKLSQPPERAPAPGEGVAHYSVALARADGASATIHFIVFDSSERDLRILDQGVLGRQTLAEAMTENGCLAGVNGGYFEPDFEPVGMLVSDGRVVRKPVHAKLLSGALVVTGNHLKLLRSTDPLPGRDARQALQSGPFLVDGGKLVAGLNDVRSARRTAILCAEKPKWALVSSSAVTLAEFGAILSDSTLLPGGLKVERALNLDGGSSTAMWARQPGASPFSIGEFGIVRDFVAIVPRE